jgi:DNA-binding MltR family transcriptional regulator
MTNEEVSARVQRLQREMGARIHQFTAFTGALSDESDRACALMACAFLDESFRNWFESIFVEAKEVEQLFDSNGPLCTFSSRIKVAFALGLLCEQHVRDLNLMRRIRNEFAHNASPLTFDEPSIANKCRELRSHIRSAKDRPRSIFTNTFANILAFIHTQMFVASHAAIPADLPPNAALRQQIQDLQERFADRPDEFSAALDILQEEYTRKIFARAPARQSHSDG